MRLIFNFRYKIKTKFESIYTGESIATSRDGRYLGTAEGPRVHVTDLTNVAAPKRTYSPPVMASLEQGYEDEDIVLSLAVDAVGGFVYFCDAQPGALPI